MPATATSSQLVHVARQPILDERSHVFGYELLYRAAAEDLACAVASNVATARVLNTAVVNIGLGTMTAGKRAFINVGEDVLLSGPAALLPPNGIVLELLETIEATDEVIAACQSLCAAGYALALDDFVPGSSAEALLPYASYVKVDVLALSQADVNATAARLLPLGVRLLAEKVETMEERDSALAGGYTLFQGYFFSKPAIVSEKAVEPGQLAQMRLVAELNRPGTTLSDLEDLIKRDAALSVRVLRTVNAAAVATRREVRSIREALMHLGLERVRQWASIWSLANLNQGSPEILTSMVVRAKACELLGASHERPDADSSFFLLGLCSMLDVLLQRSMANALESLPLDAEIQAALLGERNQARDVLDAISHYERGEWEPAANHAAAVGGDQKSLAAAYSAALTWADELTGRTAACLAPFVLVVLGS